MLVEKIIACPIIQNWPHQFFCLKKIGESDVASFGLFKSFCFVLFLLIWRQFRHKISYSANLLDHIGISGSYLLGPWTFKVLCYICIAVWSGDPFSWTESGNIGSIPCQLIIIETYYLYLPAIVTV